MKASEILESPPDLEIRDLCLRFAKASPALWEDLSFSAASGTVTAIHGANASGKSSLIHSLCGIIPQSIPALLSGEISFAGQDLRQVPLCEIFRYISVSLCDAGMQLLFPSCELELAFALENQGLEPSLIRQRIQSSLARFGLSELSGSTPQKLSGGEQRLLSFAICDSMQSPIMLLDEPETGLSSGSFKLLQDWLQEQKEKGVIIILATHNEDLVSIADQKITLGKRHV